MSTDAAVARVSEDIEITAAEGTTAAVSGASRKTAAVSEFVGETAVLGKNKATRHYYNL